MKISPLIADWNKNGQNASHCATVAWPQSTVMHVVNVAQSQNQFSTSKYLHFLSKIIFQNFNLCCKIQMLKNMKREFEIVLPLQSFNPEPNTGGPWNL